MTWLGVDTKPDAECRAPKNLKPQRFNDFLSLIIMTFSAARRHNSLERPHFPHILLPHYMNGFSGWQSIKGALALEAVITAFDRPN